MYASIIGGAPNYFPNSFSGPLETRRALESSFGTSGDVARYNSGDDDNFTQPGIFWREVIFPTRRLVSLLDNIVNKPKAIL